MFKRELSVFLVNSADEQYRLPVYNDVAYSQVYSEEVVESKTLHNPENLIQGGFTTQLNTGNFNFTIPLMDTASFRVLFSLMFNSNEESFSLFVRGDKVINFHNCVVTGIVFNLQKDAIMTASIAGNYSHSTDTYDSVPGILQDSQGLYTYIQGIGVVIGSQPIDNITSFSIELVNTIEWVNNNYMQDATPTYKKEYYCTNKRISGNIVKNEGLNQPEYNDSANMLVELKCNNEIFLRFEFPSVIVTTRNQLDEVIKKGFDFRINSNKNNEIIYKGVNIL